MAIDAGTQVEHHLIVTLSLLGIFERIRSMVGTAVFALRWKTFENAGNQYERDPTGKQMVVTRTVDKTMRKWLIRGGWQVAFTPLSFCLLYLLGFQIRDNPFLGLALVWCLPVWPRVNDVTIKNVLQCAVAVFTAQMMILSSTMGARIPVKTLMAGIFLCVIDCIIQHVRPLWHSIQALWLVIFLLGVEQLLTHKMHVQYIPLLELPVIALVAVVAREGNVRWLAFFMLRTLYFAQMYLLMDIWVAVHLMRGVLRMMKIRLIFQSQPNCRARPRDGVLFLVTDCAGSSETDLAILWPKYWLNPAHGAKRSAQKVMQVTFHTLYEVVVMLCTQNHVFTDNPQQTYQLQSNRWDDIQRHQLDILQGSDLVYQPEDADTDRRTRSGGRY